MKRTLSLKREALAGLTDDDLTGVAGGAERPYTLLGQTCPIRECFGLDPSNLVSCYACLNGA